MVHTQNSHFRRLQILTLAYFSFNASIYTLKTIIVRYATPDIRIHSAAGFMVHVIFSTQLI